MKDCARRFVLKLYRHEASRGLFATAELLVLTQCMHASYLALELFFLGVSQSVILVVSLLVKSFAAVFTDERLDPLMDPHVRIEGRGTVKRLATRATNMRLFCGVDDFVPTQRRRLSKPLIAHLHQRTESIYDSQHFISSSSIDRQKNTLQKTLSSTLQSCSCAPLCKRRLFHSSRIRDSSF